MGGRLRQAVGLGRCDAGVARGSKRLSRVHSRGGDRCRSSGLCGARLGNRRRFSQAATCLHRPLSGQPSRRRRRIRENRLRSRGPGRRVRRSGVRGRAVRSGLQVGCSLGIGGRARRSCARRGRLRGARRQNSRWRRGLLSGLDSGRRKESQQVGIRDGRRGIRLRCSRGVRIARLIRLCVARSRCRSRRRNDRNDATGEGGVGCRCGR